MEVLFVVFHTTLSLIGCTLNAVLCYVAYFKSPNVIRTYSIITINFAITDLVICFADFLLQIRSIPIGKAFVFVSYGPCKWMSTKICYNLYSFLMHVYTHTIWLLLVSFCYRYYVMIKSEPSRLAVKLLLFIVYIPSFTQMILLSLDYSDPSVLLAIQEREYPHYNLRGLMVFGIEDTTTFATTFAVVHITGMSTPIVVCIFVLRKKIMRKLKFEGANVRPKTRTLQLQLLRALTFQSVIPLFYLTGVATYVVGRIDISRNSIFEFLTLSSTILVPVLTPISSFVFVTPYRTWILSILHIKQESSLETRAIEQRKKANNMKPRVIKEEPVSDGQYGVGPEKPTKRTRPTAESRLFNDQMRYLTKLDDGTRDDNFLELQRRLRIKEEVDEGYGDMQSQPSTSNDDRSDVIAGRVKKKAKRKKVSTPEKTEQNDEGPSSSEIPVDREMSETGNPEDSSPRELEMMISCLDRLESEENGAIDNDPTAPNNFQALNKRIKLEPLDEGDEEDPYFIPLEHVANLRTDSEILQNIINEFDGADDRAIGPRVKVEPEEVSEDVEKTERRVEVVQVPRDGDDQRPRLLMKIKLEQNEREDSPVIRINDSGVQGSQLPRLLMRIKLEPPEEEPSNREGVRIKVEPEDPEDPEDPPENPPETSGPLNLKLEPTDVDGIPESVQLKIDKVRKEVRDINATYVDQRIVEVNEKVDEEVTVTKESEIVGIKRRKMAEVDRLMNSFSRDELALFHSNGRTLRATRRRRTPPPTRSRPSESIPRRGRGRPRKEPIVVDIESEYEPPKISIKKEEEDHPESPQPPHRHNGERENAELFQTEMPTASSSKRVGRNTNNSRSSIPTPVREPQVTKIRRSNLLDSDDDDDDDFEGDEMASTSSAVESTKRPRTPKPRYSPESQRRNVPRAAMSALSIETHRNTDLNADGSGPSSSGQPVSGGSERRESRRREDSSRRKAVAVEETPKSHKKAAPSVRPKKKQSSPSPPISQDETFLDDSDDNPEWDNLPIVVDDSSYSLTAEQKAQFRDIKRTVRLGLELKPCDLAEIYRNVRSEDVRLPRKIHFGKFIMNSWFGAPFPAEYIRLDQLFICEFCLYYARSDPVMQNHANKCYIRAPPGVEIYRKGDVSVFEVDGRVERDYCQNVCLISRLFLESKTLFYDTDPFFFYIVTVNDHIGCHFAGYFSKEKYEPDKNNLSCIMTLPCFQEKGFGSFLIDISYALSRREGWFGGPERPLSDLGRIAYGSYWRGAIFSYLHEHKQDVEGGRGVSIDCIAQQTGINHHDILEFLDAMGWIGGDDPDEEQVHDIKWDVDWGLIRMYMDERKKSKRTEFDEKCLDWEPRKITPKMDSFVELTQKEVEEDEEKKKNRLLQTPMSSASLLKSTPASTTSQPTSSIKKTLRSRGQRAAGRNLQLEVSKKVTVPEWASARDVTDDEAEQRERKRQKNKRKKERKKEKKKEMSRCEDATVEKKREETPEDDDAGPSKTAPGRRSRGRPVNDASDVGTSSARKPSTTPAGKGKHRNKNSGKNMFEDSDEEPSESSSDSSDDNVPYGEQKGKKGRQPQKGKKGQKKQPKPVSGKKFPPNYGHRRDSEAEEKKESDSEEEDGATKPAPDGETRVEQTMEVDEPMEEEKEEEEVKKSDEEVEDEIANDIELEDELRRDYIINTPESYHSTSPASPAPLLAEDNLPPPQLFGSHPPPQFDESDAAPPLLVSEVSNLSVSDRNEPHGDEQEDSGPMLAPNLVDGDGYSTGDDDAPPRLSPQYEKNETHEEEVEKEKEAPMLMAPVSHNGMSEYHDPMAPGPSSSMHLTPQIMSQSQAPNMMVSTPQHPFSHPNSHQQTTPGSGGIPSCGPVYNHTTPEQQAQQQQQQFMSPMAGMPTSVSSVHSAHNNSMEMAGGPASLHQHTPQQQQYDMGHAIGQIAPDNGVMSNGVTVIEQQNQIMMAQHGFSSPPGQNTALAAPQQPVAPPQVAQMPPAPAPTNGRRRSESAAQRKSRQQQQQQQQVRVNQQMPAHMMAATPAQMMAVMQPQMMVNGFNYNYMPGYANPAMWDLYNPYTPYPHMQDAMNYQRGAAAAWPTYPQPPQPPVPPNGHMPDGGAGLQQFAPPGYQWFQYNNQNNMR